MAKDVRKGSIVMFRGSRHKVQTISGGSRNLVGGKTGSSAMLWLKPLDKDAEEIDGWVNERRVKKIRRRR
jgi:hypothetical protein